MNIKVSVIVPIYNVEKYLKRAVDSLVNQTLKDIEIILVDDGSPDGCPAIIDKYEKDYPNIIAVHKENGGLSDARNAGMAAATGEYIGFIDPDDYAEPDMFEKLYDSAKPDERDFAFCGYREVFSPTYIDNYTYEKLETSTAFDDILYEYAFGSFATFACNKIFKASIIEKNKLLFPVGVSVVEDTVFFFRFLEYAATFGVSTEISYNYIRQPESICAIYQPDRFDFYKIGLDASESGIKRLCKNNTTAIVNKNRINFLTNFLATIDMQSSTKNKKSLAKRYKEMCGLISDKALLNLIENYENEITKKHHRTQMNLIKRGKKRTLFINEFFNMRIMATIHYYFG